MQALFRKSKKYLKVLKSTEFENVTKIDNITYCPCDYKESNTPPPLSDFVPFKNGDSFGENRVPAGVLYMPARRVSIRTDGDTANLQKELAKWLEIIMKRI